MSACSPVLGRGFSARYFNFASLPKVEFDCIFCCAAADYNRLLGQLSKGSRPEAGIDIRPRLAGFFSLAKSVVGHRHREVEVAHRVDFSPCR